jgi:glycosyltransferase involved in cell wall biosynthesis
LETIAYHLRDDGKALVTTPNPFAVSRLFNILADGWTAINTEHVSWLCPQTMFQLVERSHLFVSDFCWLETDFPMPTRARFWGRVFNYWAPVIAGKNQLLRNDYGVLLRKAVTDVRTPEMDRPFVSVILPTYNRSDYLIAALRSLAVQDYPTSCFEVIVVDNASTDDTPERLHRFTEEVVGTINLRYAREERRGLVFVRHTGAAHARGEILIFGDDDAVFDKNWISAVVDVYKRFPEVGAVGTKIAIQWNREPEAWVRRYEDILGKLDYGDDTVVKRGLFINGGSFSVKKTILYQVNGFNPGQRGAYIVGDSETGLCRKLANEGILVAWTPAATMWHIQRVEVNGTLADLKRRFRNNGIADAYLATFYRWGRRNVASDFIKKSCSILHRLFWALRYRDWEKFRYVIPLELALYLYYVKYLWLYRFSRTIRNEISKKDWQFTSDFQAPPAESLAEYRTDAMLDKHHGV